MGQALEGAAVHEGVGRIAAESHGVAEVGKPHFGLVSTSKGGGSRGSTFAHWQDASAISSSTRFSFKRGGKCRQASDHGNILTNAMFSLDRSDHGGSKAGYGGAAHIPGAVSEEDNPPCPVIDNCEPDIEFYARMRIAECRVV